MRRFCKFPSASWGFSFTDVDNSDVMHHQSEIEICVYDRTKGDAFLGHLRLCLDLRRESKQLVDGWHKLSSRDASEEAPVGGEIYFQIGYERAPQKHLGPDDFEILKLIGKGE